MREYQAQEASQDALTAEDLPPELLSAVEANTTEGARQFASFAAAVAAAPEQVQKQMRSMCACKIFHQEPTEFPTVYSSPKDSVICSGAALLLRACSGAALAQHRADTLSCRRPRVLSLWRTATV